MRRTLGRNFPGNHDGHAYPVLQVGKSGRGGFTRTDAEGGYEVLLDRFERERALQIGVRVLRRKGAAMVQSPMVRWILSALLFLFTAIVLTWTYFDLLRQDSMSGIPKANGDSYTVTEGDTREQVFIRCGKPCGRGDIPKADCHSRPRWPWQLLEMCGPGCDVYRDVAICYGNPGAIIFKRLNPPGDPLIPMCTW